MTTRPLLFRFTASAKNASASLEMAVAGNSLMRSRVTCADAGRASATSATAAMRRPSTTGSRIGRPQCAVEIVIEIVGVFQSGREAQQIGRTGRRRSFERGAVLDQAFDAAERGRALPQIHARCRIDYGALPASPRN